MQNFRQFCQVVSSGEGLGMKSGMAFSITSTPVLYFFLARSKSRENRILHSSHTGTLLSWYLPYCPSQEAAWASQPHTGILVAKMFRPERPGNITA